MFGRISQLQQKSGGAGNPAASESQKFVDALQADFKTLALETKKKYPQIKEVSPYKTLINYLLPMNSCLHYVFTFLGHGNGFLHSQLALIGGCHRLFSQFDKGISV